MRHGHSSERQAPGAAALEELVRVHLVGPAEEVRLGVIVRGAKDGCAVGRRLLGLQRLAPLERIEARLRLLGDGPFLVTARHATECTLAACLPRSPSVASPSGTERSRRSAVSTST